MIRAIFDFIFLTARRSLRNFPPPFWFEIFCFIIFSAAAAGGSGAGAWWTLPTVTLTYDVEPNTHTQHTHPHPLADSIGSTTTYIAPLSDGRASSETERGRPKWTGSRECKRRSGERETFPVALSSESSPSGSNSNSCFSLWVTSRPIFTFS
jgi:hypothetical protein